MAEKPEKEKPDFKNGFPIGELSDGGMIRGLADGEELVLARRGDEFFAIGGHCTHYGGPLAEGLIVGDTVRCPWHHACFSLRTGEALRAPALNPVSRWAIEKRGDTVVVTGEIKAPDGATPLEGVMQATPPADVRRVVIVGAGVAGNAGAGGR